MVYLGVAQDLMYAHFIDLGHRVFYVIAEERCWVHMVVVIQWCCGFVISCLGRLLHE
jgi:hypothetical protein